MMDFLRKIFWAIVFLLFVLCCLLAGTAAIVVIAATDITAFVRFCALIASMGAGTVAFFLYEAFRERNQ